MHHHYENENTISVVINHVKPGIQCFLFFLYFLYYVFSVVQPGFCTAVSYTTFLWLESLKIDQNWYWLKIALQKFLKMLLGVGPLGSSHGTLLMIVGILWDSWTKWTMDKGVWHWFRPICKCSAPAARTRLCHTCLTSLGLFSWTASCTQTAFSWICSDSAVYIMAEVIEFKMLFWLSLLAPPTCRDPLLTWLGGMCVHVCLSRNVWCVSCLYCAVCVCQHLVHECGCVCGQSVKPDREQTTWGHNFEESHCC